jgi:hypothetical protein
MTGPEQLRRSGDVIRWDGIEPDDFEVELEDELVTVVQCMPGEVWFMLENGKQFRVAATPAGTLEFQERGA